MTIENRSEYSLEEAKRILRECGVNGDSRTAVKVFKAVSQHLPTPLSNALRSVAGPVLDKGISNGEVVLPATRIPGFSDLQKGNF